MTPLLPVWHISCAALRKTMPCCNSAASRAASGATARLVAGGRILIIRTNTRLCLCRQLWSLISCWLPLFTLVGASSVRKWSHTVICNLRAHSQRERPYPSVYDVVHGCDIHLFCCFLSMTFCLCFSNNNTSHLFSFQSNKLVLCIMCLCCNRLWALNFHIVGNLSFHPSFSPSICWTHLTL